MKISISPLGIGIVLISGIGFVACNGDDMENPVRFPQDENGAPNAIGFTVEGVGPLQYHYEDGKLESYSYSGYHYYVSNNSPLEFADEDNEEVYSFSFNKKGYISHGKYVWNSTRNDGIYSENYTLSYDSDGHLTELKSEEFDLGEIQTQRVSGKSITLIWNGDILNKVIAKQLDGDGHELANSGQLYTFSYENAHPNPLKQTSYIFYHFLPEGIRDLSFLNYCGVGSSYLPTYMNVTSESNYEEAVFRISASLNEDGTIHSERVNNNGVWYYSYSKELESGDSGGYAKDSRSSQSGKSVQVFERYKREFDVRKKGKRLWEWDIFSNFASENKTFN